MARNDEPSLRRRDLLACGLVALIHSPAVRAQTDRVRRIGVLATFDAADREGASLLQAFRKGLQQHGWTEGQNLQIELRHAGPNTRPIKVLAAELAQANVELIVTHGTPAVQAVREAANTLPIVFATIGDPVGAGLVQSLARPGGNITGLSLVASDLGHKRLEVLKEVLPRVRRVAMLWNPSNASLALQLDETGAAAQLLNLELQAIPVERASDAEAAIETAAKSGVDAIITTSDSLQVNRRVEIVQRAMAHHIPVIAEYREVVLAGALLSYGPSREDSWRRAATYVSRILGGAKPGDLPVEQPSTYNLAVNLKTAQTLNVDLSSVLFRADEVVE